MHLSSVAGNPKTPYLNPMAPITLTKEQARKIIVHAAGLAKPAQFGKGPEAVYKFIEHLGFVQLDTNYVVERAHHHAIAARVPGYKPQWLEDLQADGRIFEFFTSDAGYMPMYNYRFALPVMQGFAGTRPAKTPAEANLAESVLDRIGREGPLRVKDFENDRQEASSGWWDWRPSKVALERLYMHGRLMVTRGKDFHRLYDLPRNVLPAGIDTTIPTPQAFARHVIKRDLQALGIAHIKELAWRAHHVKGNLVKKELEAMVAEGEVLTIAMEGIKAPLYMLPVYKNKTINLTGDAFILSPFDVLNVFRHRLRDFFGFDYQVECFVPAPKRKYGYFSLPVLLGDRFIARMDAKADRKQKMLLVHNLHFEDVGLGNADLEKFTDALKAFAEFNGCLLITIAKSNNKKYLKVINSGL